MNNLLSYCGLVDPRISVSDKDLPVKLDQQDFLCQVRFTCNVIPILLKYLGQKCSTAKSQKTNNTGLTTFHLQVAKMTFMYSTKALNREVTSVPLNFIINTALILYCV